jgi:hypothetical protein
MHLYLNYAREHWMKPGENPPVGLILCASKGSNEAHYALEGLPNKVLAAEYQTVLPDEKLLAEELDRTRRSWARRIARGGDAEGGVWGVADGPSAFGTSHTHRRRTKLPT